MVRGCRFANNVYARQEIEKLYVIGLHLSGVRSWVAQLRDANTELNNHLRQIGLENRPIYITGVSIGGEGAIALANLRLQNKQPVSAVAAFCPEWTRGAPRQKKTYARVAKIPSYIFCHRDDPRYRNACKFAKQLGRNCQFREISDQELDFPKKPHVCWPAVYRCPDFYDGLTQKSRVAAKLWKLPMPRVRKNARSPQRRAEGPLAPRRSRPMSGHRRS
jgi:dienelactone hydrolase